MNTYLLDQVMNDITKWIPRFSLMSLFRLTTLAAVWIFLFGKPLMWLFQSDFTIGLYMPFLHLSYLFGVTPDYSYFNAAAAQSKDGDSSKLLIFGTILGFFVSMILHIVGFLCLVGFTIDTCSAIKQDSNKLSESSGD